MSNSGYVYILSNPSFKEDIFKIGRTTRTPEDRAWEIFRGATGVPTEFQVSYARQVANCKEAESEIHQTLDDARINDSREFFKTSLSQAKEVFETVCIRIDQQYENTATTRQKLKGKVIIDHIESSNPSTTEGNRAVAVKLERLKITPIVSSSPNQTEFLGDLKDQEVSINHSKASDFSHISTSLPIGLWIKFLIGSIAVYATTRGVIYILLEIGMSKSSTAIVSMIVFLVTWLLLIFKFLVR